MRIVYWQPWPGTGQVAWFQEDVFDPSAAAQLGRLQATECVWIVPGTLPECEL